MLKRTLLILLVLSMLLAGCNSQEEISDDCQEKFGNECKYFLCKAEHATSCMDCLHTRTYLEIHRSCLAEQALNTEQSAVVREGWVRDGIAVNAGG